jgi:hypothetical protein
MDVSQQGYSFSVPGSSRVSERSPEGRKSVDQESLVIRTAVITYVSDTLILVVRLSELQFF